MEDGQSAGRRSPLTERWPLLLAIALLFALGLPPFLEAVRRNDGQWVYPLDDTYISLAVGKSFASSGIWGLNPHSGFSFGTSSPLYPLFLAGLFLLTGVHEITPLLVNVVCALILLWWIEARLRRDGISSLNRLVILAAVILLTPLHVLVLTGMEHTLQTLLSIIFLFDAGEALTMSQRDKDPQRERRLTVRLAVLCVLLTGIRYEALFFVFIICCLLLLRWRWRLAFFLGAAAFVSPAGFGLMSRLHGWYLLPNSVLLKGNTPEAGLSALVAFAMSGVHQLVANPHLYALAAAVLVALFFQAQRDESFWKLGTVMLFVWVALLLLHMQFAKTGWFYRYEAYLMVTGLVLLGRTFLPQFSAKVRRRELRPMQVVACLLFAFLVIWPSGTRANLARKTVARASTNVYEQQYQMARFLRDHYPEARVAANDVGAITFLSNIHCLDLFGLMDKQVLIAKRARKYDTTFLRRHARKRDIDIAIVYDWWYHGAGGIPPQWKKVGEWKVFHNVILGGDVVSFYAVKRELREELAHKLRQFSPQLPKTVEQSGEYVTLPEIPIDPPPESHADWPPHAPPDS